MTRAVDALDGTPDRKLEICCVGFGAIGTIYSLALERSGKANVTAVCRSNYRVLKEHGLDIDSITLGEEKAWRPHRVVSSTEEAANFKYDYIVCCFKALPDVLPTPQLLGPLLKCAPTFVLIQNGVDIHQDLRAAAPEATIISGCAWIDTTAVNGGRLVKHASVETLTLGIHHHEAESQTEAAVAQYKLDTFVDLLRTGGLNPDPRANIEAQRWRKVLWNAAYSTLCTLTRASVPELLVSNVFNETGPIVEELMKEVVRVARATGVVEDQLPDSAIDATIKLTMDAYGEAPTGQKKPHPYRPSMLVDLESGRPMEVEVIVGNVVRKARELGVQTPQLAVVYASLKVMQNAIVSARGAASSS